MILEPLGVIANHHGALRSGIVAEVHVRLPRSLVAQRIVVGLNKPVYEVHLRGQILHPGDAVLVEVLQLARGVKGYQELYGLALLVVFGHIHCLTQPVHNLGDGLAVLAVLLPHHLAERISLLHQVGVKPVG